MNPPLLDTHRLPAGVDFVATGPRTVSAADRRARTRAKRPAARCAHRAKRQACPVLLRLRHGIWRRQTRTRSARLARRWLTRERHLSS
jgi:hypothetical protein